MNRRHFLAAAGAAALTPAPLLAGAFATGQPYAPGLVDTLLAEGRTVFVDFSADWCSTCRAQARVIEGLKAENPAYEQAMSFVVVDWDKYATEALSLRLQIPRRSTLVALKGDAELGRIVAGTGKAQIKALMDTALAAATA